MSDPVVQQVQSPVRRRKKKKKIVRKIIAWVLVLAILAGGGYFLLRFLNSGEGQVGDILAEPAHIGTLQSKVSGSGVARSSESSAITLAMGGVVQEVHVNQGDTVFAGQPLYTVYSQAAHDGIAKLEEKLSDLQKKLQEAEGGEDILRELEQLQEAIDKRQKELTALRDSAFALTVTAPHDGKLMEVKDFSVGQKVNAGEVIATIVNDRQMKLSLYFSYAYENAVFVGQKVSVSVPVVMGTFEGTVEKINKVSYISPEGGIHFEVVMSFRNPGTLTAGMAASALLQDAEGFDIYPYSGGKLEFYSTGSVTSAATGPVETVGALMDYANVSGGQMLLQLGRADLDAEITAKEGELSAAQKALEAAQKAQKEAADAIRLEIGAVQKDLEDANASLADYNAVAPIDGMITSCTLSEGKEVKAGDTVVIITNNTKMLVTINVDDRNISFVKPGGTVELDWNGQPFMGTVTQIDMGGAQQGTGMTNYPVTLEVENFGGQLMEGAWLQYSFVTSESADCILVPSSAVQYFTDAEGNRQSVVFVQRETRPDHVPELMLPEVQPGQRRRYPTEEEGYYPVIVETGLSDAQSVEILSGVQVDDMVFVNFTVLDNSGSW